MEQIEKIADLDAAQLDPNYRITCPLSMVLVLRFARLLSIKQRKPPLKYPPTPSVTALS
jgi:hypothetical protein